MTVAHFERVANELTQTRKETLELFHLAPEAALHTSPGFGFRPILWHLAHIGVFEAFWILQKIKGDAPLDDRYETIFDPIKMPRESSKDLPSRDEMERFLELVRGRVSEFLDNQNEDALAHDAANPLLRDGYVFDLVLEHERQHQETLAYLLHLLDPTQKTRPTDVHSLLNSSLNSSPVVAPEMIIIPAGSVLIGAHGNSFAYDNERPAHKVELDAFRIDKLLTTNADYLRFIEADGYTRREFWTEESWTWREKENVTAPLYWQQTSDGFTTRTMFDQAAPLDSQHPVCGVSWFEADAYARFMNKRLPTESEWEKAAAWDETNDKKRRFAWGDEEADDTRGNFGSRLWSTTPVGAYPNGASPYGCLDMNGNVWEWTSDAFAGYDGFQAFPYPEYSQEWFDGDHRVLKGGSWATRSSILRTSFRNFFRRNFRIAFAGIRCAAAA